MKKAMKENDQNTTNKQFDTPSEANRDKHINFRDVEEESAQKIIVDHTQPTDRQKQWQEGLEEGRQANQNPPTQQSPMPMDEDDTLGIP
jgi:hypothetical protein